jgi:uncharacterized Ntn-hydrolase superfamily protein
VTYSIIGRDPETGSLGIAVQSRWFHVGQNVAWIEPGVGAVCTQAFVEPTYGPRGLELMRAGRRPAQALADLTAADEGRDIRQVALADAEGRFAQHTGARCVAAAGNATGRDCCAQGNMLARDTCWGAMVEAFAAREGELTDRLLAALEAAEREGGDARGRQSAAILVRPGQASGLPWQDRILDLRVVDHPDPVPELRRLVDVKRAYDRLGKAFDLAERGEPVTAAAEADAAHALAPGDDQITFWRATMLAGAGRTEEAAAAWQEATRAHPGWPAFLNRCIEAGIVPPQAGALTDTMAE